MKARNYFVLASVFLVLGLTVCFSNAADTKTIRLITTETNANSVKILKDQIAAYEKDHPKIKVTSEFLSWGDVYPKIMAAIAARKPPEVVYLEDTQGIFFAKEGLLQPVTDLMNKIGQNTFYPVALQSTSWKGENWMVPYNLQGQGMYYRADWYERKGLKIPETWDEWLQNAEKLTMDYDGDKKIDIYGVSLPMGRMRLAALDFWQFSWSNGGYFFDKNGKLIMDKQPYAERIAETLQFWKDMSKFAPPGVAAYTWFDNRQAYYSGKAAHTVDAPRLLTQLASYAPPLLPPTATKIAPVPHGPHGDFSSYQIVKGWGIMKGAENADDAKSLLEFLVQDDNMLPMLLTVPLHMFPPKPSIANSAEFRNSPLAKANPQAADMFTKIISEYSMSFMVEFGGMNTQANQLIDSPMMIDMIQTVLLKDTKPIDAVMEAAKKIRAEGIGK